MSKSNKWPTMRIINAFAPTTPMWEVHYFPDNDETWISPIICIAIVETRSKDHHNEQDSLETELRSICFMDGEQNGLDAWYEQPDAMGYALSPLSDAEIREKWASEIANLKRKHKAEKTKKD
jgi:hypothetical protein